MGAATLWTDVTLTEGQGDAFLARVRDALSAEGSTLIEGIAQILGEDEISEHLLEQFADTTVSAGVELACAAPGGRCGRGRPCRGGCAGECVGTQCRRPPG